MTTDTELETWQQEWRDRTEPLPEWKRKIKRQNLWMAVAALALGVCLAFSTVWAVRARSSFAAGLGAGMWLTTVIVGAYALRVRRGAWKPSAQTTLAYMELAHRRAVAKARQIRFSRYLLLAATLLFALFVAWDSKVRVRDIAIIVALAMEWLFLRQYERRKRRDVEQTKKLTEDMKESAETAAEIREDDHAQGNTRC